MVQFPEYYFITLFYSCNNNRHLVYWVTPFGYLGVKGCLLLTLAFRSLPRPSSSDSSKAFTMDTYSLNHIQSSE